MSNIIKANKCKDLAIQEIAAPVTDGEETSPDQRVFDALHTLLTPPASASHASPRATLSKPAESPTRSAADKAQEQAASMMAQARQESKRLMDEARVALEKAREEAAAIESEAYDQGFAQGKKDGEELGRRQYEATSQRLEKLLSTIEGRAETLLDKYEAQLVQTALLIARRLAEREITLAPDSVAHCLRTALRHVVEGSHVRIHANPKDVELLKEFSARELHAPGQQAIDIFPDPKVEPGGCLIETEFGLVDSTLGARWQALNEAVHRILFERTGLAAAPPDHDAPPKEAEGITQTPAPAETDS